jgi:serpin B
MKKYLVLALLLSVLPLFSACAAKAEATIDLLSGLQSQAAPHEELNTAQSGAAAEFSARLFTVVLAEDDEPNPVISPISAYLALAMTAAGAAGGTKAEFAQTLGLPVEELGPAAAALTRLLTDTQGSTKLLAANSLWLDKNLLPEQAFLQQTVDYYEAELYQCDLHSPTVLTEINGWVEQRTQGLIKDMLSELDDAALVLINALYLDAKWQAPFEPNDTRGMNFSTAARSIIKVDFLCSGMRPQRLIITDELEGIVLPYDDGRLAFVAVRPLDESSPRGMRLDAYLLRDLLNGSFIHRQVVFSMPKFEMSYEVDLEQPLQALGLSSAFDIGRADFSALGRMNNGRGLYISQVLQKVAIKVNEKGTEAAAATAAIVAPQSAPQPDDIVYLSLDSPFLYAVVELETALPLFMGLLEDPR